MSFTDTKMYIFNYTLIGLLDLGVNKGPLIRPVLKFHLIDTLIMTNNIVEAALLLVTI